MEETVSNIFFLSPGELVDLYAAYKRGSIHMTDAEEVALIEELLSRPPDGATAWVLMDLM
jgi:hypothetical protein